MKLFWNLFLKSLSHTIHQEQKFNLKNDQCQNNQPVYQQSRKHFAIIHPEPSCFWTVPPLLRLAADPRTFAIVSDTCRIVKPLDPLPRIRALVPDIAPERVSRRYKIVSSDLRFRDLSARCAGPRRCAPNQHRRMRGCAIEILAAHWTQLLAAAIEDPPRTLFLGDSWRRTVAYQGPPGVARKRPVGQLVKEIEIDASPRSVRGFTGFVPTVTTNSDTFSFHLRSPTPHSPSSS